VLELLRSPCFVGRAFRYRGWEAFAFLESSQEIRFESTFASRWIAHIGL
jgi:hypothetical protein